MSTRRRATATFDHALAEYEHHRMHQRRLSLRTWAGEKPGLRAFCDLMAERGHTYLSQVSEEDADAWWIGVQAGYATATQYTRLHQLRSFLKYAAMRGWLADDPTRFLGATPPRPKQRERLDADELLQLLEVAKYPRDRVMYALAMNLALRGGEIRRLTVGDVDFEKGLIHVTVDKTNEDDYMRIGPDLEDELRRWLLHYRSFYEHQLYPGHYLVPAQWVSTVTDRIAYRPHKSVLEPYTVVQRGLQALGWQVTKGEGEHTIRRSVATLFFDDAATESYDRALVATMALLHHDRPETTLRYIGRDKVTMERDQLMARPFLTRLASGPMPAPLELHSVK